MPVCRGVGSLDVCPGFQANEEECTSMRSQTIGWAVLLIASASGGCGGADNKTTEANLGTSGSITVASQNPKPLEPPKRTFSIVLKTRPAGLALDGKLREWGELEPDPSQRIEVEPIREGDYRPAPQPESAPNAGGAGSRLAVALDTELTIAGDLEEAGDGSLWFGLAAPVPALPSVGLQGRYINIEPFDCEHKMRCCFDGDMVEDGPLPPEAAAACRQFVARYDALKVDHARRFARVYRIEANGIQVQDESGGLAAVPGAKVVFATSGGRNTFEATLPLTALPRMSDAPVSVLRMIASRGSAPAPETISTENTGWTWLKFPTAVSFEPFAAVRDHIFKEYNGGFYPGYSKALSYEPGNLDILQSMKTSTDLTSVEINEGVLPKRIVSSLGDVTVTQGTVPFTFYVVTKGKAVMGSFTLPGDIGDTSRMCFAGERDGDLHYVGFTPGGYDHAKTYFGPFWTVTIVRADGSIQTDSMELDDTLQLHQDVAKRFSNPGCTQFGIRGPELTRPGQTVSTDIYELSWKWDKASKKYRLTRKDPSPKAKPRKNTN